MITRSFLLLVLLAVPWLSAGGKPRCDTVVDSMNTLLDVYGKEHPLKQFPSTLKEFEQFAVKKRKPLDLACFSDLRFDRSGQILFISYRCRATGHTDSISRSFIIAK